jgi:hypothetical protein
LWHLPDDVSQISREFSDIPQFCFPDIDKIQLEKADDAEGEFMVFTLRDGENKKVFGICYRHIFRGKNRRFDCLRRPRHCLCIITRQTHFSLFRNILQDIYAYALLEGASGMCRQYAQRLLEPFLHETPSGAITFVPQGPESVPFAFHEMVWHVPNVMKMQFRNSPVLPLLVALGVDRLFMLLSAIMSDRKIIFIADDHQELAAAIYGAVSMLHPFVWPHNVYTIAPAAIVARIVTDSFPFIAGIRRVTVKELPRNVFDAVVVVDLDQGMVNYTGPSPLHDLVGDSSTALKQATENLDRLRAGISSVFLGKSADNSAESSQRDIMAMLVLDLKSVMANRPGSNSLQSVATGLLRGLPVPTVKSEEETSINWKYENERTLRDCLTTLFVYLFGDLEDFLIFPTDPKAPLTIKHRFDRSGFFHRRHANGLGRMQEFMNDFLRTGVFKKFLVDMIKRVEMNRLLPFPTSRNNRTSSVGSTTSSGSQTTSRERNSSEATHDLDELFFLAANELRLKQIPLTATNAKQAVTSKSTVGAGEVTLAFGLKVGNANFHQLTLLYTNAGVHEESLDNEDVQVPVWEIADRTKESSHPQTNLERILIDARNSNYIQKIFAVLSYRLESARASLARGAAGLAGLRALFVLKILLVQGPHCMLSYGLELLPLLRQLLRVRNVQSGADFMSGQSGQHDLRPMTLRVMSLLMDHRKLMSQRHVVQIALHSKRLFFKSAMDANKGGLVSLTQANVVKRAMFFINTKQAGKQFQSFAVLHQNMNELRLRNMDAGGLKCNPFEISELEEEGEDEVAGEDVSVISSSNPAPSSSSYGFSSKAMRPPKRAAEVNLLDFDHVRTPPTANFAPASSGASIPAVAGSVASTIENPKYRVKNIDTGEVRHIREFHHIPYDTFDGAPPLKPARSAASAADGSIKLQPPPNDNQQQRVSRKTGGTGGGATSRSDSSSSVSSVPHNQAVKEPSVPATTVTTIEPPRTPPQPPRNNDNFFDALTPTTPPTAPTPSSTPASLTSTPSLTMEPGTVGGTMNLAPDLKDVAFHPTVAKTGPSTGLNNNVTGAASFNGVPPPRLNMTRGAMPIPATSSAHMMHHAMGIPPVRPTFNNSNPGILPKQKPPDPFANLLPNELNRA